MGGIQQPVLQLLLRLLLPVPPRQHPVPVPPRQHHHHPLRPEDAARKPSSGEEKPPIVEEQLDGACAVCKSLSQDNVDISHLSCCHRLTLCGAGLAIFILGAAVTYLILQVQMEKESADAGRCTATCLMKCNTSSHSFYSHLRSSLCGQSPDGSSANSACRLCPAHWHLHGETCYWSSTNAKSWDESRDDCLARNSQLVVIKDQAEMEFLKQITKETLLYWIGLFLSWPEKEWMWITGSRFAQYLSGEPSQDGAKYCGGLKSDTIMPDTCNAVFRWLCQKDAILI